MLNICIFFFFLLVKWSHCLSSNIAGCLIRTYSMPPNLYEDFSYYSHGFSRVEYESACPLVDMLSPTPDEVYDRLVYTTGARFPPLITKFTRCVPNRHLTMCMWCKHTNHHQILKWAELTIRCVYIYLSIFISISKALTDNYMYVILISNLFVATHKYNSSLVEAYISSVSIKHVRGPVQLLGSNLCKRR